MKNVIFGILALIGGLLTISACKGKASELESEIMNYKILSLIHI